LIGAAAALRFYSRLKNQCHETQIASPSWRAQWGRAMSDGKLSRVLIAENEFSIALDMADGLEERGFGVAGPFKTSAAALCWLATGTPDFGIIDVRLNDGECRDLVRELRKRGVPLVFFTGDPYWPPLKDEFADIPVVEKPAGLDELLGTLFSGRTAAPKAGAAESLIRKVCSFAAPDAGFAPCAV
jgi:hypothetical protein